MTVLKCKMCGGTLNLDNNTGIAVCKYCDSKQTITESKDEVIANLYNRANDLRLKCDFDTAASVYENIIEKDNKEAEAHWGLVLCKYGIEYVDDQKSDKKIPTCHRTSRESILKDIDTEAAIQYGNPEQKELYKNEAKVINDIQKGILNIVKNEKPFDVFISYKEKDSNGKRSQDSVTANDIYHRLSNEGLKVFYAPVTLKDKLGQEYEPYIFNALDTAKVMLVVGFNKENFTSTWVKNEWSRFLKLSNTDNSKLLIPCYKNIEVKELPEEFQLLQALNIGDVGFIQDILNYIKRMLGQNNALKDKSQESKSSNDRYNEVNALVDRGFVLLEDGEFEEAKELFDDALRIDYKNWRAYLGEMYVDYKCKNIDQLRKYDINDGNELKNNNNFCHFLDNCTEASEKEKYLKINDENLTINQERLLIRKYDECRSLTFDNRVIGNAGDKEYCERLISEINNSRDAFRKLDIYIKNDYDQKFDEVIENLKAMINLYNQKVAETNRKYNSLNNLLEVARFIKILTIGSLVFIVVFIPLVVVLDLFVRLPAVFDDITWVLFISQFFIIIIRIISGITCKILTRKIEKLSW